MVDGLVDKSGKCKNGEAECEDCRQVISSDIVRAHFILCQKPWHCVGGTQLTNPYSDLHKIWFKARQELEGEWAHDKGVPIPSANGPYRKGISMAIAKKLMGMIDINLVAAIQ